MSGGSFDYACFARDLSDLPEKIEQYEQVGLAFEADGYDDVAAEFAHVAAEFAAVVEVVRIYDRRISARLNRLHELAHAMEWQRSGDYGSDKVASAVEAYRKQQGENR